MRNERKTTGRAWRWLLVLVILIINLVVGARLYSQEAEQPSERESAYDNLTLFTKALEQIRENYVDEDKTAYKDLVYGAMNGMLSALDAHSQFMDPDMYTDMKDDTAGQFGGLGIVISIKDGILTIVAPMEDTPGFRAGLLAGDKIIEIEGESTEGVTLAEAVKTLRGEPGTEVIIKILRPDTKEVKDVTIERAVIEVSSVKDAKMIDDGIGYIRLTQFNEPTAAALEEALSTLTEEEMRGLVIDLRNNPGGLLSAAVDVSGKFLKRGEEIVSTRSRNPKDVQVFKSRGRTHYPDLPMVILVNGGSASASEIFAGALQDHKRAILLGEKTFGKGSVQSVLPMEDGSAIRLTTAKYYTPSQRVIHEKGIEPDIVVPMPPEDWHKLMVERARPENAGPPERDEAEPAKVVDVQLERAVDVLKGIMLFQTDNGFAKKK
ncbi:MAG: S41 family peptidase [Spartobacteria bacterium]|nr:S41 family peptidase [Spartobacteria bacterium]